MAEENVEKTLAVSVTLKGQEIDIFNAIKADIVARYKGIPMFRLSNAGVLRTMIVMFPDLFRKAMQYDLLTQFLREKNPELLKEFESRAKELGILR